MKKLFILSAAVFCVAIMTTTASAQSAGDYRTAATGNWGTAGTWERFDGSSWVAAVASPSNTDGVITIRSPHVVTIAASGLSYDQVTVDSGAQVTVAATVTHTLANGTGTDLTINGTWLNQGGTWTVTGASWTLGAGGTYIHNTTSGIATPLGQGTFDAASNFIYRGSSTLTPASSVSARIYGNLSFESTAGSWTASESGGGTLTVNGDFTIGPSVTYSTAQTGVMTFAGNFTNNGTLTNSTGTQVYTFNGSGKTISGSGAIQFETWNVSPGASITLGSNVSIASTFTGTFSGTLNCETNVVSGAGAFTLASGATLGIGSTAGITSSGATGNIQVTGTRTFDTGANYTYNGSAAQVTGNALPGTVNDLTISHIAGVTLSGSVTTNGTLSLSGGDLFTSTFTLTENGGSSGTGDVIGTVKRTDLGSTAKAFGNPFVTIAITLGDVPTQITVNLAKGVSFNDFNNSVKRAYTLTPTFGGTGIFTGTVQLHYLVSELNGNTESNLVLWRKDTTWGMPVGVTSVDTTNKAVQLTGVTGFSPWAISDSDTPTDVAMMNFKATRYDKQVHLEWQTGYEVSNVGFNVYREKNRKLERITPEPIAGSALIAGPRVELKAGFAYSWWDDEEIADCGSGNADCDNLRYWIEDIDLSGRTTTHGPFGVSEPAAGDPLGDQHRDQGLLRKHKSAPLSALGRDASLAQTAEAATVPVEPPAKVATLTAARMSIQSGVASQTAVKLSIQRAGWYRVEQADLVAAGLPSNADPTMLQLFADGREAPMLVTATTSTGGGIGVGVGGIKTTAWNGIEFYGLGIDSPSTANHVYWVVVGTQPGLRIGSSTAKGGSPAPGSFPYTVERRDKTVYFPALKNGGAEKWFGPLLFNAQPVDQSVTLQHLAPSGGGGGVLILVSMQGFNNAAHSVRVVFNGVQVGTMNFTGFQNHAQKFVIPPSNVHEGVNQIQLIGPPGASDLSLVDFVQVGYLHAATADNNLLRLTATGQQQVTIDGFTTSAIRVIDVTDANAPIELQTTVTGAAPSKAVASTGYSVIVTAPVSGTRTLLAFASDQQKRPAQIAANQPSNYRDHNQRADYFVITRTDLIGSYGPLADLRKEQGLMPMLIDIEDIYDEFSFGNKSPQALKDFLSYAKTSWALPPRFVVLGGDASYDPKNYAGLGDFDLVPTRLVETAFNETATDDWFADLNGDGVPDIAIGRLPVRTPAEAAAVVTKLINYDQSAGTDTVLLVADRNSNFDFEAADAQLRALLPGSLTVTDIRRGQLGDADTRTQLLAALNQGTKLVNYYGHGSTTVWADAPILSASDAAGLTNIGRLSLVVSMTCLNGYFHAPNIESLGESLLKSQGGAIAVWASSGLTDAQAQTVMSRDAISRLFNGSNLTIGEVVALAKTSVTNLDVRRTWILLGDPATKLK